MFCGCNGSIIKRKCWVEREDVGYDLWRIYFEMGCCYLIWMIVRVWGVDLGVVIGEVSIWVVLGVSMIFGIE